MVSLPETTTFSPELLKPTWATQEQPTCRWTSSSLSVSHISTKVAFLELSASNELKGSQESEWTGWFPGEMITWAQPEPGRFEIELGSIVQIIAQSWQPTTRTSSTTGFQASVLIRCCRLCFKWGITCVFPSYQILTLSSLSPMATLENRGCQSIQRMSPGTSWCSISLWKIPVK